MTLFRIVIFNYGISLNNVYEVFIYEVIYEVFTAGDGGYSTSYILSSNNLEWDSHTTHV